MEQVWFISDTHFYHGNIIRYCHRPWSSGQDENGNPIVLPKDTDKMNADMIQSWNQTVGPDDIVWHLGDFAREETSQNMIKDIVTQLNGKINLVMGNHDALSVKKYNQCGFNRVYDCPVVFNDFFILSHKPMEFMDSTGAFANIYGHVHNDDRFQTFTHNSACVCVERHQYKPVSFEFLRDQMKQRR